MADVRHRPPQVIDIPGGMVGDYAGEQQVIPEVVPAAPASRTFYVAKEYRTFFVPREYRVFDSEGF